jgi:hypothetical protein
MTTHQKAMELVKQIQRNANDYRTRRTDESIYAMAALMNQLVVLYREELGLSPFEGRKDGGHENVGQL